MPNESPDPPVSLASEAVNPYLPIGGADENGVTGVGAQNLSPQPPNTGITLRDYIIMVGVGAFVTTFAQLRILGEIPTTELLKTHHKMDVEAVEVFFFWATFAWNLKPLAGIFTDAFPFFGTRRRHYMILGALSAAGFWAAMGFFNDKYMIFLVLGSLMNAAMVLSSTVMGGLMVEAGQAYEAPGRIASLRQAVQNLTLIIAPLIAGKLAHEAYGATASVAVFSLVSLAVISSVSLKEKRQPKSLVEAAKLARPTYKISPGVYLGIALLATAGVWMANIPKLKNAGVPLLAQLGVFILVVALVKIPTANQVLIKAQLQLEQILRSRTLWIASLLLFLTHTVPGLNAALYFQQENVLNFKTDFIGFLKSTEGVSGVCAAAVYIMICRKLNLRTLLVMGVTANAVTTLGYLVSIYSSHTAIYVHFLNSFGSTFSELALMDLAVRSTPRGCEALGFSLMMSVRNFGLGMSGILGGKLLKEAHRSFNDLVLINAGTTVLILFFVPMLPRLIMNRKEGQA